MFCPKCGTQVPEGGTFCPSCGNQMTQQAAQQAPVNRSSSSNGGLNFPGMIDDIKTNIKDPKAWGIPAYLMLGGVLLYFISIFLPYQGLLGYTQNFAQIGGALLVIVTLILLCATSFAAIAKQAQAMMTMGGVMLGFTIAVAIGKSEAFLSFAVGFYFMLISAVAILVGGIMKFREDKK